MLKQKWHKFICCPVCKKNLILVKEGLYCKSCKKSYPIIENIPVLLNLDKRQTSYSLYKYQIDYFTKEAKEWGRHRGKGLSEWKKTYIKRIFNLFEIKRLSKLRRANKKGMFLDIGVGASGYTVIEAAKRGLTAVGCAISFEEMREAKEYANRSGVGGNTLWVVCNAEELPFKSSTFRYICANALLEHLPNDRKAIKEIDRVSQKRSDVYITVPLKYRYVWPFLIPAAYLFDKNIGHLRRYSLGSFKKVIINTKLKVSRVYYTGHLEKTILFLVSELFKTKKLDGLAERLDEKRTNENYGALNISFHLKNYN